jgi:hypothetical protein
MKGPVLQHEFLSMYPDDAHVFRVSDPKDTLFTQHVSGIPFLKPHFERLKHLGGLPEGLPNGIPYTTTPPNVTIDADLNGFEAALRSQGEEEEDEEEQEVMEEEEENELIPVELGKRPRQVESCAKQFEREDFDR